MPAISRPAPRIRFRLPALLLAAAVLLASAGCALNPWYTASRNIDNSKRLRVGMTKNEVLEVMGEPLADEIFCTPDCWYYYIEPVWVDGLTTEEECMPLVFEDGKLIGWGNDFYLDHQIKRRKEDPGADLAKAEAEKIAAAAEKKKAEAKKPKDHAGTSDPGKK